MTLIDSSPEFTRVPSPGDRTKFVSVRVDPGVVRSLSGVRRRTKLYELFYNVAGILPPVNNIRMHEAGRGGEFPDHWGGMRHASALFRGVQRPVGLESTGEATYVYVLNPRFTYEYVPDMVCVARRVEAPLNSVFLVYARFDSDFGAGTVLNWEWMISGRSSDTELPENFSDRYEERVW